MYQYLFNLLMGNRLFCFSKYFFNYYTFSCYVFFLYVLRVLCCRAWGRVVQNCEICLLFCTLVPVGIA